jgi:hypothetical protein
MVEMMEAKELQTLLVGSNSKQKDMKSFTVTFGSKEIEIFNPIKY